MNDFVSLLAKYDLAYSTAAVQFIKQIKTFEHSLEVKKCREKKIEEDKVRITSALLNIILLKVV